MTEERTETLDASVQAGPASVQTRPISSATPTTGASLEFQRLLVRIGVASDSEIGLFDGRYRIDETLGRGAMGVVYRAHDERLRRAVALKLVRGNAGFKSDSLRVRIEREARALAKVDHPNVVQIHDVGTHADETYLTMQYVPGITLRAWQELEGRSARAILDAYVAAARGLAAAHAEGIVHRDFKPDNVIVGDDGGVRVVDFGIAAALQEDERELASLDAADNSGQLERLTRTGTLVGTPIYMAPEQLHGLDVDARADQYSFCLALLEALTRTRPFVGNTIAEQREARTRQPRGVDALPRRLRPILLRGLAREPDQRFASMEQLIAALLRYRDRPRKLGLGLGLTSALLVAGVVGWTASQAKQVELEPCEAFVAEVDQVWSAARRRELLALRDRDAAGVDYALRAVDELASQWRESAAGSCEGDVAPARDSRERECRSAWLESLDRSVALMLEVGAAEGLARAPNLLERLRPPSGNYCALEPEPLVDREVARLAAGAREAAVFGEAERAASLANQALERTGIGAGEFSVDRAEALVAHAEVLARVGDRDAALTEFEAAQAQALASGHRRALLTTAIWRAKLASTGDGEDRAQLAAAFLELAEPIAAKLELEQDDPQRGELALARGLIAQARGDGEQAILHFRAGQAIFARAQQPTLVAKALINIGTNHQRRAQWTEALAAYAEACAVLREAGVPPAHASLLNAHHNRGVLALQRGRAEGLADLDHVARHHPNPIDRLRALGYGVVLAHQSADSDLAREWAERALVELEIQTDAPAELAVEVGMQVGVVLARAEDPRSELLMDDAEARAASLDLVTLVHSKRARIDSLIERARCDEARERTARLEQFLSEQDPQLLELVDHARWRADWLATSCAPKHQR